MFLNLLAYRIKVSQATDTSALHYQKYKTPLFWDSGASGSHPKNQENKRSLARTPSCADGLTQAKQGRVKMSRNTALAEPTEEIRPTLVF